MLTRCVVAPPVVLVMTEYDCEPTVARIPADAVSILLMSLLPSAAIFMANFFNFLKLFSFVFLPPYRRRRKRLFFLKRDVRWNRLNPRLR